MKKTERTYHLKNILDLKHNMKIQYVFQVIGSLCLFHKYTFLGS